MRRTLYRAETGLSRVWWILAALAIAASLSCAYSRPDGEGGFETVGQDLIEGVTIGEDAVGAVVDAISTVDPGRVVEDVRSGNWLEIVLLAFGLGSAGVGGYVARKKWRGRQAEKRAIAKELESGKDFT
jgi:hypothetical protein